MEAGLQKQPGDWPQQTNLMRFVVDGIVRIFVVITATSGLHGCVWLAAVCRWQAPMSRTPASCSCPDTSTSSPESPTLAGARPRGCSLPALLCHAALPYAIGQAGQEGDRTQTPAGLCTCLLVLCPPSTDFTIATTGSTIATQCGGSGAASVGPAQASPPQKLSNLDWLLKLEAC